MKLRHIIPELLDLLFPRQCVVCGQTLSLCERVMCARCMFFAPFIDFPSLTNNRLTAMFETELRVKQAAALMYYVPQSPYSRVVIENKYRDQPNVGRRMGRWCVGHFKERGFFDDIDLLVPVPLTKKGLRKRGYNQSEAICWGIRRELGLPIVRGNLVKTKETGHQVGKSGQERFALVQADAYDVLRPDELRGRHVLLVDDVFTTGATLIACAKALHRAAPDVRISVLTIGYAGEYIWTHLPDEEEDGTEELTF